jgi:hypothetical protein
MLAVLIGAGCATDMGNPGQTSVTAAESGLPQELAKDFRIKRDKVRNITFYSPSGDLRSKSGRLYAYVSHSQGEKPTLFFEGYLSYVSARSLADEMIINVGGDKVFRVDSGYEFSPPSGVYGVGRETFSFTAADRPEISAALLATEGPVLMRFSGAGALDVKVPLRDLRLMKQAEAIRAFLAKQ